MALVGSIGFAVGTVLSKRRPLYLPPIPGAAWQVGLGCLPVALVGLAVETAHWDAVTPLGGWLLVYSVLGQFCIAYVCWFAALARLPASVAAIGTMAVPVIDVVTSALALGEPLGQGRSQRLCSRSQAWRWRRGPSDVARPTTWPDSRA
jgi:drug/metabolite transporter (DMT)-like permease